MGGEGSSEATSGQGLLQTGARVCVCVRGKGLPQEDSSAPPEENAGPPPARFFIFYFSFAAAILPGTAAAVCLHRLSLSFLSRARDSR